MDLFEKLGFENLEVGKIQSVDEMTVIPITGKDRTDKIGNPEKIKFRRTTGYGSMEFTNEDDRPNIIPSNFQVLSEESAQDHAMSSAGLLEGSTQKTYTNACCIESSQGGYLTEKGNNYDILPLELRHALLTNVDRWTEKYGKLWDSIETFLEPIPDIKKDGQHLSYFFKPYAKQLEEFIAEFEPVDSQIGALIFFVDKFVGLEIMPTQKYWEFFWRLLVRGCYGAQVLKLKLCGLLNGKIFFDYEDIDIKTIDYTIQFISDSLVEKATDRFTQISTGQPYSKVEDFRLMQVGIPGGGGDIGFQNRQPVYASLIVN